MKLIIPMAGRGTRVRPHSHVTPKPLLHVLGKSMVERIIDAFNKVIPGGFSEAVFVLGPDFGDTVRKQLSDICTKHDIIAHFAVQEKPLGTAHAVYAAHEYLDGPGITVFADTLFEMDPNFELDGKDVIAWVMHVEDPSRFGVAVRDGERIKAFVEKPKELISNEALVGIYYVKELSVLKAAIEYLMDNGITGHGSEYQLTDAFDRMLNQDKIFTTASVTAWLDCGTIPALKETTSIILAKEQTDTHKAEVMDSVVIQPVYLGPGAQIRNAVIGPNVSVEAGAVVEHAVVRDAILFANATVRNTVLADAIVGQHACVEAAPRSLNIGDHSVSN